MCFQWLILFFGTLIGLCPAPAIPPDQAPSVAPIQAWLEQHPERPITVENRSGMPVGITADFSLTIPPEAALLINPYENGYIIELWAISIPPDNSFIAVNYRFKQAVGGGASAYASAYDLDIDDRVAVIYETAAGSACDRTTVQNTLTTFEIDHGSFVVRIDGSVVQLAAYLSHCGAS